MLFKTPFAYVYYLDCGDRFIVYVYIQDHQIIYSAYMQFCMYQLYLNKALKINTN